MDKLIVVAFIIIIMMMIMGATTSKNATMLMNWKWATTGGRGIETNRTESMVLTTTVKPRGSTLHIELIKPKFNCVEIRVGCG